LAVKQVFHLIHTVYATASSRSNSRGGRTATGRCGDEDGNDACACAAAGRYNHSMTSAPSGQVRVASRRTKEVSRTHRLETWSGVENAVE